MSETSNQLKTSDETAARLAELVSRAREATACKVCGNIVGDDGWLNHGRGCYVMSEDGGGGESVDCFVQVDAAELADTLSDRATAARLLRAGEKIRARRDHYAAWKTAALATSLVRADIPTTTPDDYVREQAKAVCELMESEKLLRAELERLRAELAAAKGAGE